MHAFALGRMGLRLQDFDYLTPIEWRATVNGWMKQKALEFENIMALDRMNTAIIAAYAGHVKKGIDPKKLYKLPSEKNPDRPKDFKVPTKEDVLKLISKRVVPKEQE